MTEDRVEWHLWNWSRWMYGGKTMHLRERSRASCGVGNGTVGDFDDMVELADRSCAEVTDACIDGLPEAERSCVYAKHLQGPWDFPESALGVIYRQAMDRLGPMLARRGLA